MNNVDLKFMRALINSTFGNEKVALLDNYYYDNLIVYDKDVLSVIQVNSTICDRNFLFSVDYINFIYDTIFPSIKRAKLKQSSINEFVESNKNFSIKRIFKDVSNKNIFNDLTPQICSIIISKLYYQKFNRYFVFHPNYVKLIISSIKTSNQIEYSKAIKEIILLNKNYYKIKKLYSLDSIKSKLISFSKNLLFYQIKSIYVFGSYTKNRQNELSDLDLHVYTKINSNLKEQEIILTYFFSNLFETSVDVKIDYNINNDIMFINEKIVYEEAVL